MQLHTIESLTVKKLKEQLDSGRFAIPRLQRVFVWNGAKAAKLLDSIYRGMPIGALTIWETSKKNRDLLRAAENSALPEYRSHHDRVSFVLDGQQRLTVLFRIHEGGTVYNDRHQAVDFRRLVFAVGKTAGAAPSAFAHRKPVDGEWVSVLDLLSSNWRSRLGGLKPLALKRAENARNRLLNYKVPIVRFTTESVDDAREIFIRINSAGTPISSADRAFAMASRFDLRHHAERALKSLPPEFSGISNAVLLQTRALLDGIEDVGDDAMTASAKRWDRVIADDKEKGTAAFSKAWDLQKTATMLAIDLLSKAFWVYDDSLLPSTNMVVTLTIFFVHHRRARPTPAQMVEIRKWFWATALSNRYSGRGFRQNIVKDVKFFQLLAAGQARFQMPELVDRDELRRTVYGSRSSIASAFFCLLIAKRPRLLDDGSEIQLKGTAAASNRRHKHHVFPREHLKRAEVGAKSINSILNLCFMPAGVNSEFGSKAPLRYLAPYRTSRRFQSVTRTHLLPSTVQSGLWDTNTRRAYPLFLQQREKLVCDAFEDIAGVRLFHPRTGVKTRR